MSQPRTACIYCGARITGSGAAVSHSSDPELDRRRRLALRVACEDHHRLVFEDPQAPLAGRDAASHTHPAH